MTKETGNNYDTGKDEKLVFIKHCLPQLVAGEYTVSSNIELGEGYTDIIPSEKTFHVSAPRFTLQPADIYTVYPPEEHTAMLEGTLPHIVFKRRTLPWERTIDGSRHDPESDNSTPWMALLLLNEQEIAEHQLKIESRPLIQVIKPDQAFTDPSEKEADGSIPMYPAASDTAGPAIFEDAKKGNPFLMPWEWEEKEGKKEPPPQERLRCNTMDLPQKLFFEIAPQLDDLPYLAHVRKVEVDKNKEQADNDDDGYFSVIICNRLPTKEIERAAGEEIEAADGKKKPVKNTVFLVSLEGFHNYLKNPSSLKKDKVRLVVLSHWSFNVADGKNFLELCEDLEARPLKIDHKLPNAEKNTPEETLRKAYEYGYVALPHTLRTGGKTISWYRGPLSPNFLPTEPTTRTFSSADEALRFDDRNGLVDVSYAAAWQLGRLLALKDQEFSSTLHRWKVSYKQRARKAKYRGDIKALLPGNNSLTGEERLEDLVKGLLVSKSTAKEETASPISMKVASNYEPMVWKDDQAPAVPDIVTRWLGRLFLLEEVPFNYLVAHEKLLVEETLGTFYIDPSWVEALLDGALSIARTTDSEMLLNKVKDGRFLPKEVNELKNEFAGLMGNDFGGIKKKFEALIKKITSSQLKETFAALVEELVSPALKKELKALGKGINTESTVNPTTTPEGLAKEFRALVKEIIAEALEDPKRISGHVTGFLLRSQLISGWKGVKVLAKGKNKKWLDPLRIERIETDILFCLFRGKVANVVLIQPPENLHFGLLNIENKWIKKVRKKTDGADNGSVDSSEELQLFLREESTVLDIAKIASKNKGLIASSADFAFQMVESPVIYTLAIKD